MKIREMISKVNTYNEIADVLNEKPVSLCFTDGGGIRFDDVQINYKGFVDKVKGEYYDFSAKPILSYDKYEFNKKVDVPYTDWFGDVSTTSVEFRLR